MIKLGSIVKSEGYDGIIISVVTKIVSNKDTKCPNFDCYDCNSKGFCVTYEFEERGLDRVYILNNYPYCLSEMQLEVICE